MMKLSELSASQLSYFASSLRCLVVDDIHLLNFLWTNLQVFCYVFSFSIGSFCRLIFNLFGLPVFCYVFGSSIIQI